MANNRLYIVDTKTGEKIMLAKCYCDGWFCKDGLSDRLTEWFDGKDTDASYGCSSDYNTRLILVAENYQNKIDKPL